MLKIQILTDPALNKYSLAVRLAGERTYNHNNLEHQYE